MMFEEQSATSLIRRTRLAPSPTGALHLGNARTFLINWALARQHGWEIILRIDDLDGPRVKPGAAAGAIEDLKWLGLDWHGQPAYQRAVLSPYHEALNRLRDRGLTYPCTCTRREIEWAQSAPHAEEHEMRYPGTCRPSEKGKSNPPTAADPLTAFDAHPVGWRLIVPNRSIEFADQIHGTQSVNVQEQTGDFLVATKSGLPAYQLAVVVDDAHQGVTDIVRGDDLISSTGRQLWLYRLLELAPPAPLPRYWHLPLVLGPDGRRLAKRHGDTRLASYRQRGTTARRVIGLLAYWCGITTKRTEMTSATFCEGFDLSCLPRGPVVFTQEDHAWLIACQ